MERVSKREKLSIEKSVVPDRRIESFGLLTFFSSDADTRHEKRKKKNFFILCLLTLRKQTRRQNNLLRWRPRRRSRSPDEGVEGTLALAARATRDGDFETWKESKLPAVARLK